jgi:hypothetical protein
MLNQVIDSLKFFFIVPESLKEDSGFIPYEPFNNV